MWQVANCAQALSMGGAGGTGSPDNTGKVCATADQCYPDVAEGQLEGPAIDNLANYRSDVTFVDPLTPTGSVCVPH